MRRRINYVLGGPLQSQVETRKQAGEQPRSEFNVFAIRNDARIMGTDLVQPGSPTSLRRRIELARLLGRTSQDYDVLVASGEDIGFPVAMVSLMQRVRKPIWIILHGSYLQGKKFSLIAPLLRRAKHIHFLCLSGSLREQMIEVHGFPAVRCHDAGYGVDVSFFRPSAPPTTPLVVAAGSANRDYQTLISAVDGLDVPLRVAADSLWRPKAVELDVQALPSSIEVGSAGNYIGLRALYERASFVVVPLHPARYASGYAVIAEAMAMGRAVIATRTEAQSDLMIEGETGFYVEPADVAGLRDKIRMLLGDPALARRMGDAGAQRMQEKFSLEAYCQTIEQLVDQG